MNRRQGAGAGTESQSALLPGRIPRAAWPPHLTALMALSILVLGALSWLGSRSLATLHKDDEWLLRTQGVRFEVELVLRTLADIETAEHGYTVSRDERFLIPHRAALLQLPRELGNLTQRVADDPEQRALVARLRSLADARVAHTQRVVAMAAADDMEGTRQTDDARGIAAQIFAEQARLTALRRLSGERAFTYAQAAQWATGGLAVLLSLAIAYSAVRHSTRLRRTEKALATTLRSVGDAVISTDGAGAVQFMNAVAETLTGWRQHEAQGRTLGSVFRIVNERTREAVENPGDTVLRERKIVGLANHTLLIARDGHEFPISHSGAPIFDANEIVGVVLVFRDVSGQRADEIALVQSEQRFRGAVDAVQGVLWTNNAEGEMRGEQPAWAALTGQSFEQYQGLGWTTAVHHDDAQATVDAWLGAVRERRRFLFEHRVRRHDGEWRQFSIRAIPLFDATGALREWVGVHTDVTDQRENEQKLRTSEARFRAVQDTSIDGFMVFESVRDESGQIVDFRWLHANQAAERIMGKPRTWFIGRRLLEEHPGNRDSGLFAAYVQVVQNTQPWSRETIYQCDGFDVYLRLVAAKCGDGFAVSFADLSERRRTELALKDRERQFVSLANAMPQLVWTELPDGMHEYFNRGWYAYTGLTVEESRRADVWTRVLHAEDEARVGARWVRCRATGELYEAEFRLRRHDGAYRWFLSRAIADRDAKGRILQWFGTCTDIHASKQFEEVLRTTEAALREADHRKDIFLATLSHELRNPLAPIRNAARLLEKPVLDPQDMERIRSIILRQVRHMASLLDDLLDISRITRGAFSLKKEYACLQSLLDEAVETARPLIDAKRHRLQTQWPAHPIEVQADPVRLVQVVSNLLTNAAKYTDPEGCITCGARLEDESIVIFVRDTGVGLEPAMLTKIFDMFSQVQPNQERSEGGLGIGLALVKGLVELHGGRIEARSAGLEQGSEFIVYLPDLRVATGTIQGSMGVPAAAVSGNSARRVLVADDNRDGAESLAMLLESSGCTVYLAHTGLDALSMAAEHRPHVAILDIGMPGKTGYEVAQQIRREAWGSQIVLIAVTGWGQEDDKRRAHAAGFDHHLTKPVDLEALEGIILSTAHGSSPSFLG